MRYQVRVAGRIFEGSDVNALLKCAVDARRELVRDEGHEDCLSRSCSTRITSRPAPSRGELTAA